MSVILCRRERVSHPFFIESLGIRVGSSQELCYAFYHHPLLLIDDLMGQDLMDFIREELGMGATAGRMEKWIRSGENPDDALIMFMQDCDYYSSLEDQFVSASSWSAYENCLHWNMRRKRATVCSDSGNTERPLIFTRRSWRCPII